jgi:hypothetical protein
MIDDLNRREISHCSHINWQVKHKMMETTGEANDWIVQIVEFW